MIKLQGTLIERLEHALSLMERRVGILLNFAQQLTTSYNKVDKQKTKK